jgi:predicted dehydrogenase
MASRIEFAIIGGGWRAEFFLRIAQALPDRFHVTGVVTRKADRAQRLNSLFNIDAFQTPQELIDSRRPMFVVTSVPRQVNPDLVEQMAAAGLPVLSETPPAGTVERMNQLYEKVGRNGRVQVAEQFHLQPHHHARIAFVRSGKLGRIWHAQVSAGHGYHGISLIRRYLGVGFDNAKINGQSFKSRLVAGPGRGGAPKEESVRDSWQSMIFFNFGGPVGVLDFSDDQYFSWIRGQRLLVRGERGEIIDHRATYLKDFRTPLDVTFDRLVAGQNGNLEGSYLKGIQAGEEWIYRNPLAPARLSDEEIAIGECLLRMAAYVEGGESFYSLAEACQDTYLDLLSQQAVRTGEPVESAAQAWT